MEDRRTIRPLIAIQQPIERAFLVGSPRRSSGDARQAEEHLEELSRLVGTAGAQVVGRMIQRVAAPTPAYYIGRGKVHELRAAADAAGATLVVFDEELTPAQGKNLEHALERRIMDRSEVILDIFATRARTKEARMQVELAQLEYLLPRLQRMWQHLSRIRGGIGLRGPGETQLETDRRVIRRRISTLKAKLADVAQHREVLRQRRQRRAVPTAALVGYTNAGKSSLLTALSGAATFVEDRLFATLDTKAREASLDGGRRVRLVDTVGFIRKLPHHLVASFRATLEEVAGADVLLHVIDAAHPGWEEQAEVVTAALAEVAPLHTPVIHVFNKMDLVCDPEALYARVTQRFERAVCVSAVRNDVSRLIEVLERATRPRAAGRLPHGTSA